MEERFRRDVRAKEGVAVGDEALAAVDHLRGKAVLHGDP
jgi:hypothetical protein